MEVLTKVILVLVGLINFFPVIGVTSAERLASLYGIPVTGGDLLILLQHRALLFGVLGSFIIFSAFHGPLRRAAVAMGLVSMLGFIVILLASDEHGAMLSGIAVVDAVASLALAVIAVSVYRNSNGT